MTRSRHQNVLNNPCLQVGKRSSRQSPQDKTSPLNIVQEKLVENRLHIAVQPDTLTVGVAPQTFKRLFVSLIPLGQTLLEALHSRH